MRKLSLIAKLVASYAAIAFFSLAALVISYTGLYSLTSTAREIVNKDFVVIDSANKLRESILAQQSYAAKFEILKGPEFRELYLKREKEFQTILQTIRNTDQDPSLGEIARTYREFSDTAHRLFQDGQADNRQLKASAGKVATLIETTLSERQKTLGRKLEAAKQREQSTIRWTISVSLTGLLIGLCVAALLIYSISTAVRKLKFATRRIAEGEFDFDPGIPPGDEVGALAEDFTRMAHRLKELEQMSLDASPLTRLPGNIAIEQILELKLTEGKPFAVCYADLDNLKAYNDRYGYARGSDLIKGTGELIYEVVNICDRTNAFVGHVGGDDFVMVVDPEKAGETCQTVIDKFDRMISEYYSPEDLARGSIEGVDRYGIHRTFPLMTISIAVIICQKGTYDSAVSIAKAATELKNVLKVESGSTYSINRRGTPR